ncbi:MAG: zf-HC2 domain-containing protein [Anaerolineales bacterium]|jgi:predicted anti-sigma-YlaC factor YlaD
MNGDHVDHERLQQFYDGELRAGEAGRVKAHLAGCSFCAAYLRSLARMEAGLRRMRRILPPEDFVERVLRRTRRSDSSSRGMAGWVSWAGLAVGAVGVTVLGLTVMEWLAGSPDTGGFFSLLTSLGTISPVDLANSLGSLGSVGDWWQGLTAVGATALPLALGLIALGGSVELMRLVSQAGRRPLPGEGWVRSGS